MDVLNEEVKEFQLKLEATPASQGGLKDPR
jgi:hypothetical protein